MKKRIPAIALGLSLVFAASACGSSSSGGGNGKNDSISGTYEASTDLKSGFLKTAGTDDYDRSFGQVSDYNENVVGVFYFLWASQAASTVTVDSYEERNEVEKTLTGEEVKYAPNFTYWGEPMYGYYQVEDEWVVRKHVELFINAGLDFICFDTTNNDYYAPAALSVLNVLLEYQKLGYNVPKAMFMTNSDSTGRTTEIYNAFYARKKYDSVWFTGNGDKPWIISSYAGNDEAIKNRFYFKAAQWPNRDYGAERFPWISWRYPQETFTDTANDYTIMNVSASQHTGIGGGYSDAKISGINFSLSGLFAPHNYDGLSDALKAKVGKEQALKYYNSNRGRGWSNKTNTNTRENAVKNTNFEEQWETVWKNRDVNLVFVTGWNEWIAQKQSKDPLLGDVYGYFVDTFDMEFSRDIEMMNGGYLDNCFIQLVNNIRKFKGSGHSDKVYESYTDKNMLDLANWNGVTSYADLIGDTKARDHQGVGSTYYKNDTGRNDVKEVRIAADGNNVWFMVATSDNITAKAADDTRWMNLWIGVEGAEGGWNNLQYVINRGLNGTKSSIDKISDKTFVKSGEAETYVSGNVMIVKVAKSALGITDDAFGLQVKVTDNLQKDFDIADLYTNGDSAPLGRINYSWYVR